MKTINLYTFEELTKEVQDKLIEKNNDINVEFNWWDTDIEELQQELEEQGFMETEIHFSGFYIQGYGASFTSNIDLEQFLEYHKIKEIYSDLLPHIQEGTITAYVYRLSHQYSHENTCAIELETQGLDYDIRHACDTQLNHLKEFIETVRVQECLKIYNQLQETYEYLTSPEAIREALTSPHLQYTENGVLV